MYQKAGTRRNTRKARMQDRVPHRSQLPEELDGTLNGDAHGRFMQTFVIQRQTTSRAEMEARLTSISAVAQSGVALQQSQV